MSSQSQYQYELFTDSDLSTVLSQAAKWLAGQTWDGQTWEQDGSFVHNVIVQRHADMLLWSVGIYFWKAAPAVEDEMELVK